MVPTVSPPLLAQAAGSQPRQSRAPTAQTWTGRLNTPHCRA